MPMDLLLTNATFLTMDKAQILATVRKDLNTLKGWMRRAQLI